MGFGTRMIEISEPLEGSKPGLRTLHEILLDGKKIGRVDVGYLEKEDLKTFKRSKRRMKVGQPFGVQVSMDSAESGVPVSDLGFEGISKIADRLKEKLVGLEDRDIYFLEVTALKKNVVGRWDRLSEQGHL